MVALLHRIFNVRYGEKKKAFLFSLLGFVWSLGASCGNILGDALFIANIGTEKFPHVFIATALVMFIVAIFFLRALNRYSSSSIFRAALCIGAVLYAFGYFLLICGVVSDDFIFWFVVKIFSYALFINLLTCYWTFVDKYYTFAAAKRLFALFNTAIFCGVAIGGGWFLSLGFLDIYHLFLCIVMFLSASVVLVTFITSHLDVTDNGAVNVIDSVTTKPSLKEVVFSIMSSRFTILLLTANIMIQLLEIIAEYDYMVAFEVYFSSLYIDIGEPLTHFIGEVNMFVSIGNIFIGFFIYNYFIKKFDVSNGILIIPLLFLSFFIMRSCGVTSMFLPVFGFSIVEGLLYTINDNNFTLLLNGVPTNVKSHIRVISESFFEPLGIMISATLLLFHKANSTSIGLLLSGVVLIVAIMLRARYSDSDCQCKASVTDSIVVSGCENCSS